MKTKNKNLVLFLVLLTILMISVPSLNTQKSQDEVDIFNLRASQVSWNVSEYVEFTGPPIDASYPDYLAVFRIYIDDTDPNYNWSKTKAENAWLTGSGTPGDPYIIEDLYIDAQGDGGGIYIKSTDKHFVIRDCWVNNSGSNEYDVGVLVRWSENGIIEDNIFTYTKKGVWIEFYNNNITVSGNYMISDPSLVARAVDCDYYNNDIVIDGNVIVNFYDGMYIYDFSTNVTISDNYVANFIFEEWEDAPVRFDRVNDSSVVYNMLDGVYTQLGVFAEVLGGGNNIVTDNTVVSADSVNIPEIPILSNNPKLQASGKSGVNLQGSYNNLIAHNKILGGADLEIPGYDTLLILSLAGIMFTALIVKICLKRFKR